MPYPPGTETTPATSCVWEPLASTPLEELPRGAVLRAPGLPGSEAEVDRMVIEDHESPSGFALLVTTGRDAGLVHQRLPVEARGGTGAVSVAWLRASWTSVDPDSSVDDVWAARGYDVTSTWRNEAITQV